MRVLDFILFKFPDIFKIVLLAHIPFNVIP